MTTKPDFRQMSNEIEKALRDIGVYVDEDDMRWIDPSSGTDAEHPADDEDTLSGDRADDRMKGAKKTSYVMMVPGYLGKVSFSNRVQNPDQVDVDAEFSAMTAAFKQQEFEEKHKDIAASLDGLIQRQK